MTRIRTDGTSTTPPTRLSSSTTLLVVMLNPFLMSIYLIAGSIAMPFMVGPGTATGSANELSRLFAAASR